MYGSPAPSTHRAHQQTLWLPPTQTTKTMEATYHSPPSYMKNNLYYQT
jgi:hypothetical protein